MPVNELDYHYLVTNAFKDFAEIRIALQTLNIFLFPGKEVIKTYNKIAAFRKIVT